MKKEVEEVVVTEAVEEFHLESIDAGGDSQQGGMKLVCALRAHVRVRALSRVTSQKGAREYTYCIVYLIKTIDTHFPPHKVQRDGGGHGGSLHYLHDLVAVFSGSSCVSLSSLPLPYSLSHSP
jgi:hypothetical protein